MTENTERLCLEKDRELYFKMKFPEKYIKHGDFVLHSGQHSNVFYDVNALLTNDFYTRHILNKIPESGHYVGIATGGAIIARIASFERMARFSMVKDGELKGETPNGSWVLIDDVVTTGSSLLEAISIVGSNPREIIAVVDRRPENKNPEVTSIFNL